MAQPTPEQIKEFQERLAKMSPEEREKIIKQQCLFCNIIAGKIESKKVYEDDKVIAILDINPASKGHTLVIPKEHYSSMLDMPDEQTAYLFKVANRLNVSILKSLNASASNIMVSNGTVAGQNVPHTHVHIIPRYENDSLNLTWLVDKAAQTDSDVIKNKISENTKKISFVKETIIKEAEIDVIDIDEEERQA